MSKSCREYIKELKEENILLKKQLEIFKLSNNALQEENLDYRYDITDTDYERAKEMCENWQEDYEQETHELKDKLALTEKALELACEEVSGFYCSDYCGTEKDCENCWYRDYYTAEHFKTKAKEMMKSE